MMDQISVVPACQSPKTYFLLSPLVAALIRIAVATAALTDVVPLTDRI
jgi:hypothetical protein